MFYHFNQPLFSMRTLNRHIGQKFFLERLEAVGYGCQFRFEIVIEQPHGLGEVRGLYELASLRRVPGPAFGYEEWRVQFDTHVPFLAVNFDLCDEL